VDHQALGDGVGQDPMMLHPPGLIAVTKRTLKLSFAKPLHLPAVVVVGVHQPGGPTSVVAARRGDVLDPGSGMGNDATATKVGTGKGAAAVETAMKIAVGTGGETSTEIPHTKKSPPIH